MRAIRSRSSQHGLTLLEMLFVVAITGIVVAGITNALVDLDRTSRVRTLNATMQGEGRDALQVLERDVRQASYGASNGIIWTQDTSGNVALRPAVQIFDNVPGGRNLDVKPGTDAILLVGVTTSGGVAAAQGTSYGSTQSLMVTDNTGFNAGDRILAGSYQQAAWSTVQAPVTGGLTLSTTQNIWPDGKLESGAMVRGARARLYFVDTLDELVRVELAVPRAPGAAADMLGQEVIARGFENLQIECETDTGAAVGACPGASAADPTATEAVWGLGTGVSARFNAGTPGAAGGNIGSLRSVVLVVVVRSQSPARDQQGDVPIAVSNQSALAPGLPAGADPNEPYLRRSYRLPIAVRNVSLGVL